MYTLNGQFFWDVGGLFFARIATSSYGFLVVMMMTIQRLGDRLHHLYSRRR